MSPFVPGAVVLGGRFRLVRLLGEGGMGVVWEVAEVATGARYAIKFVKEDVKSTKAGRRLRREAATASAIQHPNIVRVLEVADELDGSAAIVMELLEGETLARRIEAEGSLSLGQACAILLRVASALRAAHAAGVVHRDLKPENVFIVRQPDGAVDVRVLDFGIAKQAALPAESVTVTGTIMGTPMYMSPEQAAGEKDLDARTDVWSIAVIAFECLTARTPVTGDNYGQLLARLIRGEITRLRDVQPMLPPDLLDAVDGALVPREQRSLDLGAFEAVVARHAEAAIRAPRVVVQSDPSLRAAAGSTDSLVETIAVGSPGDVTSRRAALAQTAPRRGSFALAMGLTFAAVVLVGVGAVVYLGRAPERPPVDHASSATAAGPDPTLAQAALTPSASAVASVVATADVIATARATVPSAGGGAPPRTSSAPRTTGAAAASAAPSTSGSAGPKRLQGGVAGEVPF